MKFSCDRVRSAALSTAKPAIEHDDADATDQRCQTLMSSQKPNTVAATIDATPTIAVRMALLNVAQMRGGTAKIANGRAGCSDMNGYAMAAATRNPTAINDNSVVEGATVQAIQRSRAVRSPSGTTRAYGPGACRAAADDRIVYHPNGWFLRPRLRVISDQAEQPTAASTRNSACSLWGSPAVQTADRHVCGADRLPLARPAGAAPPSASSASRGWAIPCSPIALGGATSLAGRGAHDVERLLETVAGWRVADPSVRQAPDAIERRRRQPATHPERDGLLHRPRQQPCVVDRVVAALEGHRLLRPQAAAALRSAPRSASPGCESRGRALRTRQGSNRYRRPAGTCRRSTRRPPPPASRRAPLGVAEG